MEDEVVRLLRGDLSDATSESLLSDLAEQEATGCLVIEEAAHAGTGDAQIHLRAGKVYAAALPGGTFLVGTRLTTSFGLNDAALGEALEAQRAELHGWRLGEILVHLGHVDALAVDTISREQVMEIITETSTWRSGGWRFRSGDRTRAMLAHALSVPEMLEAVHDRQREWSSLLPVLGSPTAPLIAETGPSRPSQPVDLVALLDMIDARGAEGLQACSHAAGFSLLEGARLVSPLFASNVLRLVPMQAGRIWVSHALTALLALGGSAAAHAVAVVESPVQASTPVPAEVLVAVPAEAPAEAIAEALAEVPAEDEMVATVLDLTAARAARAVESPVAASEAAAAEARREAFAPAFTVPPPRDRPVPVDSLASAASATDEEDEDALQLATDLRAAAELHAQRESTTTRRPVLPAAFTAPTVRTSGATPNAPVPAWTRPADPAAVAASTWGQGFLSSSPPPAARTETAAAVETAAAPTAETAPAAVPVAETAPQPDPRPAAEPTPVNRRDPQADTASLMRELTSLGLSEKENEAATRPAPAPRTATQQAAPAAANNEKKRKSFFGR